MINAKLTLDRDFALDEVDNRIFGSFVEHLGQERPQGHRGRVHAVLVRGEGSVRFFESPLDVLFGKHFRKGESVLLQERQQQEPKPVWQRCAFMIE